MSQIKANGIAIEYDIHGPADGEPLLLIMGLGAQMTRWPEAFCEKLGARGFRVIRYDNRDVGLSEKIEAAGVPDLQAVFAAVMSGQPAQVGYTLTEMAADGVGLLDALGVDRAHVVGASMGGMIAQLIAADYPQRTLSLTSIMSTSGDPGLPPATQAALGVLANRGPDPLSDLEGYLTHSAAGAAILGSPGYPPNPASLRERLTSDVKRNYYPIGFARQYAAVLASPARTAKLAGVTVPSVVVHGEDDPLVPVAHGRHTAQSIPGAELKVIPGMGHDLPEPLFNPIIDAIEAVARRSHAKA